MSSLRDDSGEALDEYLAVVSPLMEAAGAKLISRYEVSENLSETELPQFVSVIEYPDEEAVQMVFGSPAYLSLKDVKERAFSRYDVCVAAK